MKRRFLILLAIILSFCTGYGTGIRRLYECEQRNKVLHDDLVFAIKRGVIMEANYNLCKDQKK